MEPSPISGLGGGWIDHLGKLHEVSHDSGRHHAEIIAHNFGTSLIAEHDILIPEMFVDFGIHHGWIRIIVNRSGVFFHFSPKFLKKPAYRAMVSLIQGRMVAVAEGDVLEASGVFSEYGFDVVEPTVFVTFQSPKEALRWLNVNIRNLVI